MRETMTELGMPAATVTSSVAGYMLTGDVLWLTLAPALVGALMSTYRRWGKGIKKLRDAIYALLSALVFGVSFGPWVAEMLPESQAAVAPMCFAFAMIGTNAVETLDDVKWDIGAFLKAIIGALPVQKK